MHRLLEQELHVDDDHRRYRWIILNFQKFRKSDPLLRAKYLIPFSFTVKIGFELLTIRGGSPIGGLLNDVDN